MSIRTQLKRFGALANQIRERKTPLSDLQLEYLAEAFEKISNGCPADIALGLRYTTGHSTAKELSVEERALVLHWMTCAMQPVSEGGHGLDLEQATIAVMHLAEGDWINPTNGKRFTTRDSQGNVFGYLKPYTYDTIKKMWSSSENQRFKKLDHSPLEVGSPYDVKNILPK